MIQETGSFSGLTVAGNSYELPTRSDIENPLVPFSDPAFWESTWSERKTASGVKMGPGTAMSYAPFWQGVSMISGGIARLPLNIYEAQNDSRSVARKHPAFRVVRRRPNAYMPAFRLWRQIAVHLLVWNQAFAYVDREPSVGGRPGRIRGLYPLLPDRTCVEFDEDGELFVLTEVSKPKQQGETTLVPIPYRDVLHFAGIEFAIDEPLILIDKARESFATGLAAQNFTSRFFGNGVKAGGILEVPPGTSETYVNNLEKGVVEGFTKENKWFKTMVLRDGVKWHRTSVNPADAQTKETRDEETRQVARFLNIQPSRLGLADSGGYNSKSEDNRDFLETTLSPWLSMICSECEIKLIEEADQERFFCEHDASRLLSMNYREAVTAGAIAVKAGLVLRDEWRLTQNLPPLPDGAGQEIPSLGKLSDMSGANKGENDKPRGPAKEPGDDQIEDPTQENTRRRVDLEQRRRAFSFTSAVRKKVGPDLLNWLQRRSAEWCEGDPQLLDAVQQLRELVSGPIDAAQVTEQRDQLAAVVEGVLVALESAV